MNHAPKMLATQTPNLYLRGRVFYFRTFIPTLNPAKPYSEFCLSLRTSDPARAKHLAAKMVAFMSSNKGKAGFSTPEVRERVLAEARAYFQDVLAGYNADIRQRKLNGTLTSLEDIAKAEHRIAEDRADLGDFDFRKPTKALAQQIYAQKFADLHGVVDETDVNTGLCEYLTRARMSAAKLYLARLNGAIAGTLNVSDELFRGLDLDILPPQAISADASKVLTLMVAGEPIEKALEAYISHKDAKGRNEKTIRDTRTSMGLFQLVFPQMVGVREITKAVVVEFESKLSRIPANFSKLKDLKSLSYDKLLVAGKDMPKFAPATYDKHVVTLRAFVRWCQETDLMDNFKLPGYEAKDKGSQKDKRESFSDEDLVTLLTSPQYTGHEPDSPKGHKYRSTKGSVITRDSYYWMPLVAMFSGMRLNEIAQLEMADMKAEDGILYFHITDEGEDPQKSVKNTASKRKVPVHPTLLKLGFANFLQQGRKGKHTRVFFHFKKGAHESYGSNYSKYFGRFKKEIGITNPKRVFHSFRHRFIDQAVKAAKLTDVEIKTLVGHAENQITHSVYGAALTMTERMEAISKINTGCSTLKPKAHRLSPSAGIRIYIC